MERHIERDIERETDTKHSRSAFRNHRDSDLQNSSRTSSSPRETMLGSSGLVGSSKATERRSGRLRGGAELAAGDASEGNGEPSRACVGASSCSSARSREQATAEAHRKALATANSQRHRARRQEDSPDRPRSQEAPSPRHQSESHRQSRRPALPQEAASPRDQEVALARIRTSLCPKDLVQFARQ